MTKTSQTKFKETELGLIPEDWQISSFCDNLEITSSKRIFMSEYVQEGIPFYRGKEIIEKSKGSEITTDLFISEEKYSDIDSKFGSPRGNDILLSSVGTLGIPYLVGCDEKFYFKDGNLTWFRNYSKRICPQFLYYWITSPKGRGQILGSAIGSTQQALTIEKLKRTQIALPALEEQKKIAEVLGALDEKIELNRKMNNTLESLAQAIFKKMFSNAESDPIVELGKKIAIKKGKNITKNTVRLGSVPVVAGGLNPSCYHDTANTVSPVVTVSASGANAGFIRLYQDDVWASDCSYVDKSVTPNVYFYYLYLLNNSESVTGLQRGSAQPHVYPKDLMELTIPDYNENLILEFEQIIAPIFELISNNSKQIENLSQMRDSLLPRLMSGKLRVK